MALIRPLITGFATTLKYLFKKPITVNYPDQKIPFPRKAIFDGFDIELPELTLTLIRTADFAVQYFYLIVPVAFLGLAASAVTGATAGITFGWLVPMTAVCALALAAAEVEEQD